MFFTEKLQEICESVSHLLPPPQKISVREYMKSINKNNNSRKRDADAFFNSDEKTVNLYNFEQTLENFKPKSSPLYLGEKFINESFEKIHENRLKDINITNRVNVIYPQTNKRKYYDYMPLEGVVITETQLIRVEFTNEIWKIVKFFEDIITFEAKISQNPYENLIKNSENPVKILQISLKVFLKSFEKEIIIKLSELFDKLLSFFEIKRNFVEIQSFKHKYQQYLIPSATGLSISLYPHQQEALSFMLFHEQFISLTDLYTNEEKTVVESISREVINNLINKAQNSIINHEEIKIIDDIDENSIETDNIINKLPINSQKTSKSTKSRKKSNFENLLNFPKNNENCYNSLICLYEALPLPNSEIFYYNRFTGVLMKQLPELKPANGGILADDMGMGKTLTAIALLLANKSPSKPTLIVTTVGLISHWRDEIEKNCQLKVMRVHKLKDKSIDFNEFDVILVSYGTIARDYEKIHKNQENYGFYNNSWFRVILDEAQIIASRHTYIYNAICSLNAKFRWCLTGTPISNSLDDLFSYVSFLKIPIFNEYVNWSHHLSNFKEDPAELIYRLMKPIFLRRTKNSLNFTKKTEEICEINLNDFERKIYCKIIKENTKNEFENNVLLRKLLDHPLMIIEDIPLEIEFWEDLDIDNLLNPSSKFQKLLDFVIKIKEKKEKCIVFTQFLNAISIIQVLFDEFHINTLVFNGKLSIEDRDNVIEVFNDNEDICCLLCTLKIGALGLNLTMANHVFILEPWWSPSLVNQAIERIYRLGQKKDVSVTMFFCKDTVEEEILKVNEKKTCIINDFYEK